jgi:serine/threonine protein kinase/Tfp pilus assembly protein PilF
MSDTAGGGSDARIALDALFDRALDMDAAARAALLEALQRDDPAQAAELRELLALAVDESDALQPRQAATARWQALFEGLPDTGEDSLEAQTEIGVWRPLRVLGRGGMGTVYLAERHEGGFRQQGALKRVHADVDSDEFLQRFAQERQILASLNHPGIARLLDGGRDREGRPYLVMEYVEGEPLDRHCDAQRLDIGQRVALFLQVANAIGHAHRNLVAHRDLKPSNILVAADGTVKLLDFGIAKVLSDDVHGAQPLTRTALRMFTPEYATPEQVLGETAAAAADIYQLGLLLYELLSGHRAHRVQGFTQRALEEAICRTPVAAASTRIGDGDEDRALCALRDTTPAALRRKLRGDLDNILLKALRKEPERRYISAGELVDDLERWRQGLPVRARPETFRYLAGKFVRRHVWAVGAAATIVLLLAGYAVTATLQSRALERERDRARAEALKAQQVQALVLRLFEGADPEASGGVQMSARELLDRGWVEIERELEGQPDVQAVMLDTVGEAYRKLGEYQRARPLQDRALTIARGLGPTQPQLLARALRNRGRLHSDAGDYAAGETLLREALGMQREAKTQNPLAIAEILTDLGLLNNRRGDRDAAEALYRESLDLRRRVLGAEHPLVAANLDSLGALRRQHADYPGAEALFGQALAIYRKRLPPTHPQLAGNLSNLAIVHADQGDLAEAERLYREALTLLRASLGERHPSVAIVMNNLAKVLHSKRDFAGARSLLEGALAIRRQALGERHEMVALNLNDLGLLAFENDALDVAEDYYRQALAAYEPEHPWRSATVFNLAHVHEARGDYAAAERGYRDALLAQRAHYGPEHDRVGTDLLRLGIVLHKQGRLEPAETAIREALAIFRKRLPDGHPRQASAALAMGLLLLDRKRPREAAPLLHEALRIRRVKWGEDDPRTRDALVAVGRLPATLR